KDARRGAPLINWSHLPEALAALDKKRPDPRSRVEKQDINFVIEELRKRGDEVHDSHERSIRRRIEFCRQDRIAYEQGQIAKAAGERRPIPSNLIPSMKRSLTRAAWYCGYDGVPFPFEHYWDRYS